jgi:hypothetical protein
MTTAGNGSTGFQLLTFSSPREPGLNGRNFARSEDVKVVMRFLS